MSKKLSEIDLARRLHERTNVSESLAVDYISTYFSLIREGLEADGVVKIAGLGTFKLVTSKQKIVAGEELQMPVSRISFTAEKELAGRLNEPYAHLTTINLDETDMKEEPLEPIANAAKEYFDEEIHEIPLPIHADSVPQKEPEVLVANEPPEVVDLPNALVPELPKEHNEVVQHTAPNTCKFGIQHVFVAVTAIFCLVVLAFIYVLIPCASMKKELQVQSVQTTPLPEKLLPVAADTVAVVVKPDSIAVSKVEEVPEPVSEILARETIRYGSRLTLLARKYYGNKHFWCYIYEENKSRIANPNNIPVGMEILIPVPSKYGIDANSVASVAKAKKFCETLSKRTSWD
ncbi:MAG: HU family DNA-binding protein [Bacteroidales bacterium]